MKTIVTSILIIISTYCVSQTYEIYVSDAGKFRNPPWQILKYDGNGMNPEVFINSNLNWPQDILFLDNINEVLISNLGSGCINKHNAITGAFISNFACGINDPTRIKIGPDSLLYVLQWEGNGKVLRYDLNGTYLGEFTSVGVPRSIGLDWDVHGNLYVSSFSGDYIRKFDSMGIDSGIFINTNLVGPTNIWFDMNGDLLVADYLGTAVKRYDSNGLFLNNFLSGLSNCEGVASFPNGDILIGNGGTKSVKMFNSNGVYLKDFIESGLGNLLSPNAIVIKEISTTGVKDLESFKSNILYPTMGKEFNISVNINNRVVGIELFDLTGRLVKSLILENENRFNTYDMIDGIYIASIKLSNGKIKNEKIFITGL